MTRLRIKILYLSGLNIKAPILNNEQKAVFGAKTKSQTKIIWEEQLLDPTSNYIQVTLKTCTNI